MKIIEQLGTITEAQGFLFSQPIRFRPWRGCSKRERERAAA